MNNQKHQGQLNNIIIGTVVREGPISGDEIADILIDKEKKNTTRDSIKTQLARLAIKGRIIRTRRGIYEGC